MKTVFICPKVKGNTGNLCSYAARKTGSDLFLLEQDDIFSLLKYDRIVLASGVYGGKLHKQLSSILKRFRKEDLKTSCKIYIFLTWFGRSHSDRDAFQEAKEILNTKGIILESDTFSCFGAGFCFIRHGHPDKNDRARLLEWVQKITMNDSSESNDTELPFIIHIEDFVYPLSSIHIIRETARGIILKDGCIALMHIVGTDKFGVRDHWETPGGGIEKDETPEEGLHREIQEELGCTIHSIRPVGRISNDYNLIGRCDRATFFVAETGVFTKTQYTEEEKSLFKNVDWIPVSEIVNRYENYSITAPDGTTTGVQNCGRIIHKRDLMMIKRAIELYDLG